MPQQGKHHAPAGHWRAKRAQECPLPYLTACAGIVSAP